MARQDKSQSGVGRFAREQPLLTAVLCIAFGVALGCALRMTPEDTEFLGEQAGKLKDRASKLKDSVSDFASDGYDKAKQFAERAASDGYDKAKQFAERAASKAADTIKGAAEKGAAEGDSIRQETENEFRSEDTRLKM